MHVLLYIALCAAPALVLLPVWQLDREPRNEIIHHQEGEPRQDPDGALMSAPRPLIPRT